MIYAPVAIAYMTNDQLPRIEHATCDLLIMHKPAVCIPSIDLQSWIYEREINPDRGLAFRRVNAPS